MRHDYLVRFLNEYPLAILPAKLAQIEAFLEYRLAGGPPVQYEARRPDPGPVVYGAMEDDDSTPRPLAEYQLAAQAAYAQVGAVAVLPVFGTILPRADWCMDMSGGTSLERLSSRFRELMADPSVSAIVLDVDSPGGSVFGVQEFAQEVLAAREHKRIVAVADHLSASAAYWIASSATEYHMSPSAQVGSIGVVAMHVDYSENLKAEGIKVTYIHAGENKVEGNPAEPLDDDARAHIQAVIDQYYDAFLTGVARGRGITKAKVIKDFGQGRCYGAAEAKERGMVDKISTLTDSIRVLQPRKRTNSAAAAGEADIAAAVLKAS